MSKETQTLAALDSDLSKWGTQEIQSLTRTSKPWNPRWKFNSRLLLVVGLFLGFPLVVFFALNWRRLGKPQWMAETLLTGVLLTTGMVTSLALLMSGAVSTQLGMLGVLGFAFTTAVFTMSLSQLQSPPYDEWKTYGLLAAKRYRYDFDPFIVRGITLVLVVVGVLGAGFLRHEPSKRL